MRPFPLLLLPLLLPIAGCAGLDLKGCSGAIVTDPAASYAGRYTATFVPNAGATGDESLEFTLATDGTVTGAAGDETVGGEAGNRRNGCDIDGTQVMLEIGVGTTDARRISATRERRGTLTAVYPATRSRGTEFSSGTLTVRRVSP